jgi:ribosomal protein L16 Arg81 hydroxylase
MNNEAFDLKTLIYPMSVDEFIQKHWIENKPVVIHSGLERFKGHEYLFDLLSLEKLGQEYHGRVSMIHPNGKAIDVQSGKDALPYLKEGYTVYFRHIQKYFPKIQGVLDNLAKDLSMPKRNFTSEIFTSSGISGVQFHSDYDLNISILLAGDNKTWKYAENKSILNQTGICMPAGKKQIEQKQVEYLTDTPLPSEMPDDSISETLLPGDLIFMPRGWWHTTHSVGDCISVNFVMKGPHWGSMFANSLESILVKDASWREYPYWSGSQDPIKRKIAVDNLSVLIEELKSTLFAKTSSEISSEIIDSYIE